MRTCKRIDFKRLRINRSLLLQSYMITLPNILHKTTLNLFIHFAFKLYIYYKIKLNLIINSFYSDVCRQLCKSFYLILGYQTESFKEAVKRLSKKPVNSNFPVHCSVVQLHGQ